MKTHRGHFKGYDIEVLEYQGRSAYPLNAEFKIYKNRTLIDNGDARDKNAAFKAAYSLIRQLSSFQNGVTKAVIAINNKIKG